MGFVLVIEPLSRKPVRVGLDDEVGVEARPEHPAPGPDAVLAGRVQRLVLDGPVGALVHRLHLHDQGVVADFALIVEVKAMYKRTNWTVKDETLDPPCKHCIWPGRGVFGTCFNTNLVIEPDTDWLSGEGFDYKDKAH